jgi:hypothetical protein
MRIAAALAEYEIRVQSYSSFHEDLENATTRGLAALRSIRIVPELEEQVTMDEGACIGVHVRRTDHAKCIAASPVAAFERAIEHQLVLNKDARFCLVTDDLAVKMRFQNLYGEAIYSPTTVLGRMTPQQQYAGVIDWLLLHRCSKILASAGSSFSELAALRAGIELVPVMPFVGSLGTAAAGSLGTAAAGSLGTAAAGSLGTAAAGSLGTSTIA